MNSGSKNDFANFVKLKNLNKEITSNKTKHVIAENEFKKLQTFQSSLFIGESYFNNDRTTLKRLADTENIVSWTSKELSTKKT